MPQNSKNSLTALVEEAVTEPGSAKLSVGDVVDKMGARGFGPLLIIPSIFILLPTGAIPGVPAVMGLILAFCGFQIMIGKKRPWLPEKMRGISIKRRKAEKAFNKRKKTIRKIDDLMSRRLSIMTRKYVQRITGALTFLLSIGMIFVGFIPFAPDAMAVPVLFFGLGFIAHDGLFVLLGFVLLGAAAFLIPLL